MFMQDLPHSPALPDFPWPQSGSGCIVSRLVRGVGSHRTGALAGDEQGCADVKKAGVLLVCLHQGLILPFSTPVRGDAAPGHRCSRHPASQPPSRTRVCSNEALTSSPRAAWLHLPGRGRAAEGLGHGRLHRRGWPAPVPRRLLAEKTPLFLFCRTKWWLWTV